MKNEKCSGAELDIRLFIEEAKKHKRSIAGILLICTLLATVYAFCKPVEYKSEAVICLRNPGVTGGADNRQTIMLLKKDSALSGIDISYSKDVSCISLVSKGKSAQEAHDAVAEAIEIIKKDIAELNEKRGGEEEPSIEYAKKQMNDAREKYQYAKSTLTNQSAEYQNLKDEYDSKRSVYENQLNQKAQTLYTVNVIDEPDYPEKPHKARRGNNILLGFLAGCVISFIYCLRQYRSKE